jgi:RimJ/RimL family protein N-acetyltransferase
MPWPPVTIDLDDVVLRRWAADDVPALTVAVVESLAHLQPWMVWATPETATEADFTRFREETTARAADGHEAVFGIFAAATGAVLGGVGLHDRVGSLQGGAGEAGTLRAVGGVGGRGVEIGYWLHVGATGRGLMTRIVGHLTDLALAQPGIRWVEIRCDEANVASAAVPRRLGFQPAATIPSDRPQAPADTGRDLIWTRTTPVGSAGPGPTT